MDKVKTCKHGKQINITVNDIIVAYFDTEEKILKVSKYWLKDRQYKLVVYERMFGEGEFKDEL